VLRKYQSPLLFTQWQLQQIKNTNRKLRDLNRDAFRELQRVGYPGLTTARCRVAGHSLRIVALRMISALEFLQHMLIADQEQQTIRVRVRFVTPCDCCEGNRQLTRSDDDEANSREALKQDPDLQTEIDNLLGLAHRTEELVLARHKSRGSALPLAFLVGMSRLKCAVLQQQQQLRAMGLQPGPAIEVEFDHGPEICPSCHKVLRGPIEEDDWQSNESATELDRTKFRNGEAR
jgi:hypothetical protein